MTRDADGRWCGEGRLNLVADRTYKRIGRLAGRGTHCQVAIAPSRHRAIAPSRPKAPPTGARLGFFGAISCQLRVTAADIKSGIARLKTDLRDCGRFICTPAGDSVTANQCRLMT